eukprot:TRINITY_DN15735_c0_g1_i2.p2 TRINITY_DN15735_c0_g1~~TRINITY_DN15735_c0_g1_i2.p2  ORF type:complete len:105 (+),score=27.71 TRINITY_DN15735_c0_g1_i2:35-349(+)
MADENTCTIKFDLEEKCAPKCNHEWKEYEECTWRIKNYDKMDDAKLESECHRKELPVFDYDKNKLPRETLIQSLEATADCAGQYLHYWHCVDKCTAPQLWSKLK